MKSILFAVLFLCSTAALHAQVLATLEVGKNELSQGDSLKFQVVSEMNQKLEIAFFSEKKLMFHQNTKLNKGAHQFKLAVQPDWVPGTYFVLVTGEGVHEQRTVYIR